MEECAALLCVVTVLVFPHPTLRCRYLTSFFLSSAANKTPETHSETGSLTGVKTTTFRGGKSVDNDDDDEKNTPRFCSPVEEKSASMQGKTTAALCAKSLSSLALYT